MTDADGRRRVELASETITKHIVGITCDIAEEEEDTNKRRREQMDDATTAENPAADQPTGGSKRMCRLLNFWCFPTSHNKKGRLKLK